MRSPLSTLTSGALILLSLCGGNPSRNIHSANALTPEELFDLMIAKDRAMEAVQLNYTIFVTLTHQGDPYWKYPGDSVDPKDSVELTVRYLGSFASSGNDCALQRTLSSSSNTGDVLPIDYQKWNLIANQVKEIIGTVDPIIDVYPESTGTGSIVALQCLEVKLVHGYGLGSLITQVTSFVAIRDAYQIEGTLAIGSYYPNVQFTATIIDRTYLIADCRLFNFTRDSNLVMQTTATMPVDADTGFEIITLASIGSLQTYMQVGTRSFPLDSWRSSWLETGQLTSFVSFANIPVPTAGATLFDRQSGHSLRKLSGAEKRKKQDMSRDLQALITADDEEICGAYVCCLDCICCGPGTEWNGQQCVPLSGFEAYCNAEEPVAEGRCVSSTICTAEDCCGEGAVLDVDPTREAGACYCVVESGMTDPPLTRPPRGPTEDPTMSPSRSPTTVPSTKCRDCSAGWITQQDIIGGLECQHGPENDPSDVCKLARDNNTVVCKELDPENGNCDCFQCQDIPLQDPFSITCKSEIRTWNAWCGVKSENNGGTCRTGTGTTFGPTRMERKASTINGSVCDGANGSFLKVDYCGPPSFPSFAALSCKASNCAAVGGFGTVKQGVRDVCA